jgi:predicted metalloprotease with PDZ domain
MKNKSRMIVCCIAFLVAASFAFGQKPEGTMAFTVFIEQPSAHMYHVVFRCDKLKGATQDFKMPVWMPGFYSIIDYAKNVQNFSAEDGAGKPLTWEKTAENIWRVASAQATAIRVTYDVLANSQFVANSYLDDNRGYIAPSGIFMHVDGQIRHPVTVTIVPNPKWSTIASGLDPVSADKPHTYTASDFDILYDSPILMGNLESLPPFEIRGIPHYFIGYNLGVADPGQFMKDLKAVIEAGIAVIGEIPYKHYTFLSIGPGGAGIEHLNSMTMGFSGAGLNTRAGRIRALNFLAHEYFHNYNVKRIRPIALGPFNYDKANLTNMLWVSEGFTSYYEFLMVKRAGIKTDEEFLDDFRKTIAAYENNTGHLFQSAIQSSHDTWSQGPFGGRRGGGGIVKTISYYDKGAALGLLLDFRIRHETKNQKSLDTVMRTLYQKFYKELKRGWTDAEFQAVCESVAGVPLAEIFEYASTTEEIDYPKYLAYAGLELEKPKELPDPYWGAIAEDKDGKLIISVVEGDSPARQAGLAAQDEIKALDGVKVDAKSLNETLASKKPGDKVQLTVSRADADRDVEVVLGHKMERSFNIHPIANADPLQAAILKDWMKGR